MFTDFEDLDFRGEEQVIWKRRGPRGKREGNSRILEGQRGRDSN